MHLKGIFTIGVTCDQNRGIAMVLLVYFIIILDFDFKTPAFLVVQKLGKHRSRIKLWQTAPL